MFAWTDQRLRWLQDAIDYTGYYDEIAHYIRPCLSPADSLCEIGCGLAGLSLALADAVRDVRAVDVNPLAVEWADAVIRDRRTENIETAVMDWRNIDRTYDVVAFSYFGAVQKEWKKLESICRKYVVAVLSAGASGLGFAGRLYTPDWDDPNGRETVPTVRAFLLEQDVPFTLAEQELEFGQPFSQREEAMDFLDCYYKIEGETAKRAYLDENLEEKDGFWYLPKRKRSGVFIIDMQAARQVFP
ncbi:MAG: hypothetical protein LBT26_06245 [Clostridiales Family XIII bacterium]|jgi:hypothetical protein|nr:hypothetical protein [Clostridiales Family XIII bacterium]